MRLHHQLFTALPLLLLYFHLITALPPPSNSINNALLALNSSLSLNQSSSPSLKPPNISPINYPDAACGYYTPPYGGNIANDKAACRRALLSMLEEGQSEGGIRILRPWTGVGGRDKKVWEAASTTDPSRKCWVRLRGNAPRGQRVVGSFSYDDIYKSADFIVKECLGSFDRVRGRQWGTAEVPHGRPEVAEFAVVLENQFRAPLRSGVVVDDE